MKKQISCFLPASSDDDLKASISALRQSNLIDKIFILGDKKTSTLDNINWIQANSLNSSEAIKKIADLLETEFALVYIKTQALEISARALARMVYVCRDCCAGMVYADFYEKKDSELSAHPTIEYQEGSLRNDFDFGSVLIFSSIALKEAASKMKTNYLFAGLYDLRLKVSQAYRLIRIPELLYTEIEQDTRKSGEKLFDYVDPKNRAVQIEMETACSDHLKAVGAFLEPRFMPIKFESSDFEFEASVVIPVRNRAKTIVDAIQSVLVQQTNFKFNLIIVDNFSTDGTSELIESYAQKDARIIHLVPKRKDLGIGGCWNEAIHYEKCGRFAIQLDSDDLYIDENVVQKIVREFYVQNCAMLVGSYQMVNFQLQSIPPGLIDHKEWTPENGRNNALRINGLGAPRAFYTPILRSIDVPNVSYGEDYALGLNISRCYQIGRIYEALYLCRRWDENSDASLDIVKMNGHNFYKDKIRTLELWARQKYVAQGQPV